MYLRASLTQTLPISELSIEDAEAEFGPDKRGHKSPLRRCLASDQVKDPALMIRFVLSPEAVVTPDVVGKLPGRGVWVSADRVSLETAIEKRAFARGFKSNAKIEGDLIALTERLLARRVLGLITMARKSGVIAMGFDQVQSMAREASIAFRLEASDGSPDGRGKIRTLSKAINRELGQEDPYVIGCFDALQLGAALARDSVVHAAIKPGGLARSLRLEVLRLSGFRALIPVQWPDIKHETAQRRS